MIFPSVTDVLEQNLTDLNPPQKGSVKPLTIEMTNLLMQQPALGLDEP